MNEEKTCQSCGKTDDKTCQSCGMTVEDGAYCRYCTDKNGNLQSFDERLERMVQWMRKMEHAGSREEAEAKALAHMATMPAWRDHPRVKDAVAGD